MHLCHPAWDLNVFARERKYSLPTFDFKPVDFSVNWRRGYFETVHSGHCLTPSVPPIQNMYLGLKMANGSIYLDHNIRVESKELVVLCQRKVGLTTLTRTAYLRCCLSDMEIVKFCLWIMNGHVTIILQVRTVYKRRCAIRAQCIHTCMISGIWT